MNRGPVASVINGAITGISNFRNPLARTPRSCSLLSASFVRVSQYESTSLFSVPRDFISIKCVMKILRVFSNVFSISTLGDFHICLHLKNPEQSDHIRVLIDHHLSEDGGKPPRVALPRQSPSSVHDHASRNMEITIFSHQGLI